MKLFRKLIFTILAAVFFLATAPVCAETGLYSAAVAVPDDSLESRKQGTTAAFEQMLIKVTGNRSVLNHRGVPAMVKRASGFMQQFRYQLKESADPEALPQRYLRAQFDRTAVDLNLRSAGLQPWNSTRPRMLVWLAWDDNGQRSVVNTEMFPEVAQALNDAADRRGFPLRLPLFDLMDQGQLNAAQIWTVDKFTIEQASGRYPQNAILVGRMTSSPDDLWSIAWTLLEGDSSKKFVSKPADLTATLAAGVDQAVDQLAKRYAPVAHDADLQVVQVKILDVQNLADYAHVLQLFEQQDAVASVVLVGAGQQDLLLKVNINGDVAALGQALELTGQLVQELQAIAVIGSDTESIVTYRLR